MEKVLFVDWGRDKTSVRPIRLSGEGFLQDARFDRTFVVAGDYDRQVYEVATIIARIKPDRVVLDCGGVGIGLGQMLRDMLGKLGIKDKTPDGMPTYNPPRFSHIR